MRGFQQGKAEFKSGFYPLIPCVQAFADYGDSAKVTVMKFDGNNWVNVGNAGFSTDRLYGYVWLSVYLENPMLDILDYWNAGKATVMKFDGTNWVNVGNADFSAGETIL